MTTRLPLALFLALTTTACDDVDDHDHDPDHDHGAVTRLEATFAPEGGGEGLTFVWSDPEQDGDPNIDPIVLGDDAADAIHEPTTYTLTLTLWNDLVDPAEDVTSEIADEGDVHQFFFTGGAAQGPASNSAEAVVEHAYADLDGNGLPIGLENTVTTLDLGNGDLTITLRHLPPENDTPIKDGDLAATVADDGFGAIGGDSDLSVTFPLTVQ